MQAQSNKSAIDYFPQIKDIIKTSKPFERNQIVIYTLRQVMETKTPINTMSQNQLAKLEQTLINDFKLKQWI